MKLSISLTDADVALIDELQAAGGYSSRSAVIQAALAKWKSQQLQGDYAAAWDEWDQEGDGATWDASSSDGLGS
jgi:Arc/MetJ-type ribon-helix-helix transcriptional regulator